MGDPGPAPGSARPPATRSASPRNRGEAQTPVEVHLHLQGERGVLGAAPQPTPARLPAPRRARESAEELPGVGSVQHGVVRGAPARSRARRLLLTELELRNRRGRHPGYDPPPSTAPHVHAQARDPPIGRQPRTWASPPPITAVPRASPARALARRRDGAGRKVGEAPPTALANYDSQEPRREPRPPAGTHGGPVTSPRR